MSDFSLLKVRGIFFALVITSWLSPGILATSLLDLMDPTPEALNSACDTGYTDQAFQTDDLYILDLGVEPKVRLQTPLATALVYCQNTAFKAKPRPELRQIPNEVLVQVYGRVPNFEDANSFTASLVLRDANGQVTDRFPNGDPNQIALAKYWPQTCQQGKCFFEGYNLLHFRVTDELKTKLRTGGARLEVQVSRLGEVVQIPVPSLTTASTPKTPLDTKFGLMGVVRADFPSGNAIVYGSAVQADGRVIAGGVSGLKDAYNFALARYDSSGVLDKRFGVDGLVEESPVRGGYLFDLDAQADGKVVAVGYGLDVVAPGSAGDVAIVRFSRTGTLDPSFGNRGVSSANLSDYDLAQQVKVQPDGKILVCGYSNINGAWTIFLGRLLPDGRGDPSFGSGGLVTTQLGTLGLAHSMALQPDGKIVLVGQDGSLGNRDTSVAVLRYLPNGQLDTGFGRDGRIVTPIGSDADAAYSVAIQTDGRVLVAGSSSDGTRNRFLLLRYDQDGRPDLGFGSGSPVLIDFGVDSGISSIGVRKDGKIVAVGYAGVQGYYNIALARYLSNGAPDPSFGVDGRWIQVIGGGYATASSLELLPDDSVIVVGSSGLGTLSQFVLCKLLP
jgi:uncharacterized delta-60 repeat protein